MPSGPCYDQGRKCYFSAVDTDVKVVFKARTHTEMAQRTNDFTRAR